ncbi:hypothetical protein K438DRAFT_1776764 [Mycena galopus ATCC 62051]|nr:hypothetical protein K438DRAFT_1776764 [Mycena galopus ATCC 62051]
MLGPKPISNQELDSEQRGQIGVHASSLRSANWKKGDSLWGGRARFSGPGNLGNNLFAHWRPTCIPSGSGDYRLDSGSIVIQPISQSNPAHKANFRFITILLALGNRAHNRKTLVPPAVGVLGSEARPRHGSYHPTQFNPLVLPLVASPPHLVVPQSFSPEHRRAPSVI